MISDPSVWRMDISAVYYGQCHSLEYPQPVGSHLDTNMIWMNLNNTLSYDIFIHDPKYFLTTLSPAAFPHIRIKRKPVNDSRNFDLLYLKQTLHHKLNRDEYQCEDDQDYNFRSCVKNSVIKKVGCRMSWDDGAERVCSGLDEMKKYEQEFLILSQVEEREVLRSTQCLPPCHFREFSLVENNEGFYFDYGLGLAYATTEVIQQIFFSKVKNIISYWI